ncbi:LysR substrate-binding domain-containing protein [Bordetella sp. LUAb4]|uniref:LysR substrate-binding domain-containing protein n=1 Tax=Bordetella sp. LUAb4 TaxID=2843195 RepID=UPI001E534A05|nr:LysR substrate-binding domain-containing protein [Bordetella sp. LUAb4]
MDIDAFWRGSLKLRHLRLLIALDDHRHVSRVAAVLHLTQPAVSKALAEIEDGVGLKLFERTPRGITPTSYGECLISYARRVDIDLARARDGLKSLALGTSGSVSIGTLPAAASVLLPRALAMFKQQFPDASAVVREGSFESLLPELRTRGIHLIVGTLMPSRSYSDLDEKALGTKPLTLVARNGHPLARRRQLKWADLHDREWVMPTIGSPLRRPLEEVFLSNDVPLPRYCLETTSTQLVRTYVSMTDAIAFMPSDAAQYFGGAGLLRALPLQLHGLVKPTGVIWSRDHPLDPVTQRFVACLEAVNAQSAGPDGERGE